MKPGPLLTSLFLLCNTSIARDIDGHFAVLAPGGNSCGDYLTARAEGIEYQRDYINWLSGYFSAFNQIVASTFNVMGDASADEILQRIETRCRSNEGGLFINAAAAVTRQLYESRANLSPNADNRAKWTDLGKISDSVK
jgi:hypothetical protein